MEVVAAVLALVALVLLVLLIITRRSAVSAAAQAGAKQKSLESDLAAAQRDRARAESSAETARQEADIAVERARSELDAAITTTAATEARASEAAKQAKELRDKVDSLERYGVELTSDLAATQEGRNAAQAALADAHQQLESERAAAETLQAALATATAAVDAPEVDATDGGATGGEARRVDGRAIDPELLWSLEMTRSERTWRHSVAVDPDGPSPFPDALDPLKMAVEVEAAAMREEVGAFITVQWDAEAVADPIRRLLVLRIANELLAAASREPQPFLMSARGSDDVVIELRSSEEGDSPIRVDPPRFGTDVMSFVSDERGVTVTVR